MEWKTNKNQIDELINALFGKKIGVIGVDNSGKSTLLKLINKKIVDGDIPSTMGRDRILNKKN